MLQLSKILARVSEAIRLLRKTQLSRGLGPPGWRGLQAKTKKAFRGIALEGLVLNEYRSLGRFPLLGVAEQAAVTAARPRLGHGPAHTTAGALEAGHERGPRLR